MKNRLARNDLIFLVIVGVCCIALLLTHVYLRGEEGERVIVTIDGEVCGTYPLAEEQTVEIRSQDGGLNILKISQGKADVTEANCPDKLCVHQMAISKDKESIVCLPHKLVISVESRNASDLDAVVN